jgi:hypothetical protein
MGTTLTDIIVPEVFDPYIIQRTAELAAIFESGIVKREAVFDMLAGEAAQVHNMPFFEDLMGESEPILESEELTANKLTSNVDVAPTIRRAMMWSSTDLASSLSGTDPMQAVAELVAQFWARDKQKELIAILKGVFGTYTDGEKGEVCGMSEHILDLTAGKSEAAKTLDKYSIGRARALMGDAEDKLTGIVMHSATRTKLEELDLLDTVKPSSDIQFNTYQGKRVIVDDGCPVEDGVYTTYLFGDGAFAYGVGNPVGFIQTETSRDARLGSGVDYLICRQTNILHPRGISWTDSVREHMEGPTRAELANAANWKPVYDMKQIRMVALKHKL